MSEIQLHAAIKNLLDSIGVCYIHSRSDKRATNTPGTPDFIFAVLAKSFASDAAVCWEVKLPGKKLRPEQEEMKRRMTTPPNAWRHYTITSIDQAIAELKSMRLIT